MTIDPELIWDFDSITGCSCGFIADASEDGGYGGSDI